MNPEEPRQWCRLYGDWMDVPKIQEMSERYQRRHAMLLCMHSKGLMPCADERAAFCLRITMSEWVRTRIEFESRSIWTRMANGFGFLSAWAEKQYESDTNSTARSRKSRARKRDGDATLQGRCRDAKGTHSETETETETDKDPLNPPKGESAHGGEDVPKKTRKPRPRNRDALDRWPAEIAEARRLYTDAAERGHTPAREGTAVDRALAVRLDHEGSADTVHGALRYLVEHKPDPSWTSQSWWSLVWLSRLTDSTRQPVDRMAELLAGRYDTPAVEQQEKPLAGNELLEKLLPKN